MSRKKKHKKKWKKKKLQGDQSNPTHEATSPTDNSKEDKNRFKTLVIAVIIVIGIVAGYYLLKSSGLLRSSFIQSSQERIPFPQVSTEETSDPVRYEDFLGSESCAPCHNDIYQLWKNSTHGRAGGPPTPDNVIGKFDGREREYQDAVMTPFINSDKEYMFRIEPKGLPPKTYKVHAVVGGGHMVGGGTQTYFTKMPDGTLRFLPYDFHRGQQVWFGELTENQGWVPISKNRPLDKIKEYYPSRVLGLDVTMDNCQQCHGSQIMLDYDIEKKKYETRYKSLSINCESCHGPGKRHVQLMNLPDRDTLRDIGMRPLVTLDKDESLKVCFSCHALKDVLDPNFLPGKELEDHYSFKFPILSRDPYQPDGRIRRFGYQQNHLYSDCFINGSMTCVDCHDPHSQSYRDINGSVLADRFDDGQCTSCHASKAINPPAHTFHKKDSPGSKCVSCHMPYLDHKQTGEKLKYARSDHTIPIPRPGYDAAIGVENACYQCHEDRSIEWLQAKTEEWYGKLKPHNQSVTAMDSFHVGMDRLSAGRLLLRDSSENYMGQMAALGHFTREYLSPDMEDLEPEIVDRIKKYIESLDIDVKSLAMASLHLAKDHDTEIHNYLVDKLNELPEGDRSKVRDRWAHAMPYIAMKFEMNGDLRKAIDINKKALEIDPENPAFLLNLARSFEALGEYDSAINYCAKAIRIDANDEIAWLVLGINFQNKGQDDKAFECYKKVIEINPWIHHAYVSIGNYYDRTGDNESAIESYKKAIEVDPRMAISYFYLAMSYLKSNDREEALESVRIGLTLDPDNRTGRQVLQVLEAK